ncbi:MAG TPA: M20 family metallopeptidase, partial [Chloroflexota bacterium]
VVDLTRELVRFPTVNPPGNERESAEFLGRRMEEMGLEVEVQTIAEQRANVLGRIRGRGEGPSLVLTGHLDVVPPGGQAWTRPPFDAVLEDGRIYGRGSCDMKGGVAAMVAAAATLVRDGFRPQGDIVLACTAGEEAGLQGALVMVERRSLEGAGFLVVAEPTDLNVYIGEKGVLWLRIFMRGRTAHGSMPWLGANAVSAMAQLIPALEAYPFPFKENILLGKPTLSVNVIEGGNKLNVVPDLCRMDVDLRTVPGQSHADIVAQVQSMANHIARSRHPDLRVEVEIDNDQQPLETHRDDALVLATVESVRTVCGRQPQVGGVTFATDAAQLGPAFDIPMVICGPGASTMAHQPDEYIEVDQLIQAVDVYVDLARRLMS